MRPLWVFVSNVVLILRKMDSLSIREGARKIRHLDLQSKSLHNHSLMSRREMILMNDWWTQCKAMEVINKRQWTIKICQPYKLMELLSQIQHYLTRNYLGLQASKNHLETDLLQMNNRSLSTSILKISRPMSWEDTAVALLSITARPVTVLFSKTLQTLWHLQ